MPPRDLRLAAVVVAVVFLLEVALQSLVLGHLGVAETPDYRHFYRPVAENLLEGRGLVRDDGTFAARYPPGYALALTLPLGLAARLGFDPDVVVRLWSLLLAGLSTGLVFLGARLCFEKTPSLVAAGVWSLYPPALWMFRQHNAEVLFTPLLLAAVVVLLHAAARDRATEASPVTASIGPFCAGLLCGAAALVRPAGIGLGLLMALLWPGLTGASRGRAVKGSLLILTGFLALVTPWELMAHRHLGRLIPLSTGGPASVCDGLTFAVRGRGYREQRAVPQPARRAMLRAAEHCAEPTGSTGVIALVVAVARAEPIGTAELLALKAVRSWYGTDSQRREWSLAVVQILFLPAIALGLVRGVRRGAPATRRAAWTATAVIVYLWLTAIAALSIARYTVPAIAVAVTLLPAVRLAGRDAVPRGAGATSVGVERRA